MADKIGQNLVKIGAMTQEQVDDLLKRQKEGDNRLFGEIAIDLNYINDDVLAEYLEWKAKE
jgi:hypothetical protein